MTQHAELIDRLRKGSDAESAAWDDSGIISGLNSTMETAADAIEALEREVEALRKDAERYRWLRKRHWSDTPPTIVVTNPSGLKLGVMTYSDERLDEVVDAAIQHEGASNAGT